MILEILSNNTALNVPFAWQTQQTLHQKEHFVLSLQWLLNAQVHVHVCMSIKAGTINRMID